MTRQLVLIRHASSVPEPSLSQRDWGLSEKGKGRCVHLAEQLRPYRLQQIFASSEVKARQTAEHTAAELQIPWTTREGFEEQGGRDAPWIEEFQEFLDRVKRLLMFPTELIHGSETGVQTGERFSAAVQGLLQDVPEGNLGIVTHGRVLTLFLAQHTAIDPVSFWRSLAMPYFILLMYDGDTLLTKIPEIQYI